MHTIVAAYNNQSWHGESLSQDETRIMEVLCTLELKSNLNLDRIPCLLVELFMMTGHLTDADPK